ncbi:MAG: VOC family protein [Gemmatimonadaceae bacterium]
MTDSPEVPDFQPADAPLVAQSLQVALTVAAARTSAAWYRDALGFTIDREFERDGRLIAVRLRAGAIQVLLTQEDGAKGVARQKGEGFSFQITTSQAIDAIAARARQAGVVLDLEPTDAGGARVFRLRDPDGFRITVSSPRET